MLNKYVSLGKIEGLDTKGWPINLNQVVTPKRDVDPYNFVTDKFFESSDEKYACLVYTIVEWSMLSYSGLIAVFENKASPVLVTNPKDLWFSYEGSRTLFFDNDFLFIRLNAYNRNKLLSGTPFTLIDLKNRKFGFVDFDASSIYYSPKALTGTIYQFHLDTPNEIVNSHFTNRHGQTFDAAKVSLYDMSDLGQARKLYKREKAQMIKRQQT